jgi:hypothetical protein
MMSNESDEQFLIRYLWHHHVSCPRCGNELHGLKEAVCPGCREALRIGVGMAQPPLRGWLAVAVPTIGSAGVGLMLLILVLTRGLPSERRYPFVQVSVLYFCLAIPLALGLVIWRRKVMRWGGMAQGWAAGIAWVLSAGALALMFVRG